MRLAAYQGQFYGHSRVKLKCRLWLGDKKASLQKKLTAVLDRTFIVISIMAKNQYLHPKKV